MMVAQSLARARRVAVLYENALERFENEVNGGAGEISTHTIDDTGRDGVIARGPEGDRADAATATADA
jgi:hypothetical protein